MVKKVLWKNNNSYFDCNEWQSVSLTEKSLIVDNGKEKLFYRKDQVKKIIEEYKRNKDLQYFYYLLYDHKPYRRTKRD